MIMVVVAVAVIGGVVVVVVVCGTFVVALVVVVFVLMIIIIVTVVRVWKSCEVGCYGKLYWLWGNWNSLDFVCSFSVVCLFVCCCCCDRRQKTGEKFVEQLKGFVCCGYHYQTKYIFDWTSELGVLRIF